jgi:putative ABC transport system permease protein
MKELLMYSWKEICRRKLRSWGILVSYGSLVIVAVLLSVSSLSLSQQAESTLWDIGAHTVAYVPSDAMQGCCSLVQNPEDEGFFINNSPTQLIPYPLVEEIRRSPNIADASAYLVYRIRPFPGKPTWLIGGYETDHPKAFSATMAAPSQITQGRFIEIGERNKIMVEEDFARIYGIEIGRILSLSGKDMEVVGLLQAPLRPGKANVYMNINDLQSMVKMNDPVENPINAILIESKGALFHKAAHQDIQEILSKLVVFSSYGCYAAGIEAMGITRKTSSMLFILVMLMIFGFSIKTQSSSLLERKKDFGILLAIAWTKNQIQKQILLASMIMALLGSLLAGFILIILGLWGPFQSLWNTLPWSATILSFSLPFIGSGIAGVINYVSILNLRSADILRQG